MSRKSAPQTQELDAMGLDGDGFESSGNGSLRGPCPRCGGSRRCLVFTDDPRGWPHWHVQCDLCGLKAWADELNTALRQPVPDELRAAWKEQREREERSQREERERKLSEFTAAELWRAFQRKVGEEQRAWWTGRGIPEYYQEYLRVGYTDAYRFKFGDEFYSSAAYTIPIFEPAQVSSDWHAINTQYRLVTVPEGAGKYRQEYGLPAAAFYARPDDPAAGRQGRVIVVEGSIKAAVTYIRGTHGEYQVIGVPGATSYAGVPARLKDADEVYIALDPDTMQRPEHAPDTWQPSPYKLARQIGKRARVVNLPGKVDDLITQHGMTARDLGLYLRQAVKVA